MRSRPPRKPVAPPSGRPASGDDGGGGLSFDGRQGLYADVKLGTGDFEPVRASTPAERAALLRRVERHVERSERARKSGGGRSGRRGGGRGRR